MTFWSIYLHLTKLSLLNLIAQPSPICNWTSTLISTTAFHGLFMVSKQALAVCQCEAAPVLRGRDS